MQRKRLVVTIVSIVSFICLGFMGYVAFIYKAPTPAKEGATVAPLTVSQVGDKARLGLGTTAKLDYGEVCTLNGDWVLAARFTIDTAALPQFLSDSALDQPVTGLRVVPSRNGRIPSPDTTTPTTSDSASPSASPAGGAAGGASPAAPVMPPAPIGSVLTDDPQWYPDRALNVSGISRDVRDGIARWLLFDMDDPKTVTIYVYASADNPLSSRTASPTGSPKHS
jgi:hypothetical protein